MCVLRLGTEDEVASEFAELLKYRTAVPSWPLHGSLENQSGNRIQIVGDCRETDPFSFEGNAPPSGGWVEYRQLVEGTTVGQFSPLLVFIARRVGERALVAIGVRPKVVLVSLSGIDSASCGDWISMDSEHMQKSFVIGIRWQQGGENRRA